MVDTFALGGPNAVPATVSFEVTWKVTGDPAARGSGSAVSPTDPASFTATLAPARAEATFAGEELGFSFTSDSGVSSDRGFAELGRERNGAFLT